MLIDVADPSQIAVARRTATDLIRARSEDEVIAGRAAIVAGELASNLLKHAGRGYMAVDCYADGTGTGVEILAWDKGTGIANVPLAMADGFSTSGTAGGGLGAIQRQSDQFSMFSKD